MKKTIFWAGATLCVQLVGLEQVKAEKGLTASNSLIWIEEQVFNDDGINMGNGKFTLGTLADPGNFTFVNPVTFEFNIHVTNNTGKPIKLTDVSFDLFEKDIFFDDPVTSVHKKVPEAVPPIPNGATASPPRCRPDDKNCSRQFTVDADTLNKLSGFFEGDLEFHIDNITFQFSPVETEKYYATPEPLTILGAGTAIAFGGAFKRRLNKIKS